jgi:hypothetical protein
MKALIIYALTWFLALAAAGVVYLTGNFNEMMVTIFGFIFATLFFAGFVAVLPFWVDERHTWKY